MCGCSGFCATGPCCTAIGRSSPPPKPTCTRPSSCARSTSWTCRWGSCTRISAGSAPCAVMCRPRCTTSTLPNERLRAHGAPVGELLADRCELLLSVRLLPEAMQAAEEAVLEFEQQRRKIGLPEARLLLAQAAILDGQASRGLQEARTAVREFGQPAASPLGHAGPLHRFAGAAGRRPAPGAGVAVGVRQLEQRRRRPGRRRLAGSPPSTPGCWLASLPYSGAGPAEPARSSSKRPGDAAGDPPCSAPRPGTPRRCSGGPVATAAARRSRPAPRCASWTSTGPALERPICAPTPRGTGSKWPSSGYAWRSTAAGPPACLNGPNRAGPAI